MLDRLRVPIVQAPMAGGPSTPRLAAAVCEAGGLGFVAAGYRTPDDVAAEIAATRELTAAPFGVNLFAAGAATGDPAAVGAYVAELAGEAQRAGVALGAPRRDDDGLGEKVALLERDPVAVVSFAFGCPAADVVAALQRAGSAVWVTVTGPQEARAAADAGADALVVQGVEAGGHRGTFADREDAADGLGLLAALQLVGAAVDLPLVATGGIATGRAVAAVLVAGAAAAQVGSVLLRCPEAATSSAHRDVLAAADRPTRLTRAFTGRQARGIANRFMDEHGARAPVAYPEIHHVTAPLRAEGRRTGDPEVLNLWAGQAYPLALERPAAEIVAALAAEARQALADAARR
jgi:nitronate monooxygenase